MSDQIRLFFGVGGNGDAGDECMWDDLGVWGVNGGVLFSRGCSCSGCFGRGLISGVHRRC